MQRARAGGWLPPEQGKPRQWTLLDSNGDAVALHVRIDLSDGKKKVVWMQPNGTASLGGRKVRTLPLYGSEQINGNSAKAVVIVEGEKATDALRAAAPELLVLGTVTGAASCPNAEVLVPVVAAKLPVYLWPDADGDGDKHMQRVGSGPGESRRRPAEGDPLGRCSAEGRRGGLGGRTTAAGHRCAVGGRTTNGGQRRRGAARNDVPRHVPRRKPAVR